MKEHFCPTEKSLITYQGKCNWCEEKEWVGLTDEEIKPCWHEACQTDLELTSQLVVYFARAIEAKLKEKNT